MNDNAWVQEMVDKAYRFAIKAHEGQTDKGGKPYIDHVMYVASNFIDNYELRIVAMLHDVVEDTEISHEDIVKEFGEEIANLVDGVTKLTQFQQNITVKEQQVEDYRKMFLAMGKDIRVILIKLADRLHNMRTLKFLTRDRQIAISKETTELYAPLANRLGLYSIKWELEDLSFKYLKPDLYKNLEYYKLTVNVNQLFRVDGNHRLEALKTGNYYIPFSIIILYQPSFFLTVTGFPLNGTIS